MTILVRSGVVAASRRYALELVKPSSVVVTGSGSETATVSALGSVEFSAAATLSLNDVFTSGYDNYMIVCRYKNDSADQALICRLRLSGTDNATANSYTRQLLSASSTTVSGSRSTTTASFISASSNDQRDGMQVFLYGPALAQPTAVRSVTGDGLLGARIYDNAFTHNQSTAYDGITFYPGGGTISGRIAVYGLRG